MRLASVVQVFGAEAVGVEVLIIDGIVFTSQNAGDVRAEGKGRGTGEWVEGGRGLGPHLGQQNGSLRGSPTFLSGHAFFPLSPSLLEAKEGPFFLANKKVARAPTPKGKPRKTGGGRNARRMWRQH